MTVDAAVAHIERTGNVHHRRLRQTETAQHVLGDLENSLRGQNNVLVHARTVCFRKAIWRIVIDVPLAGKPLGLRGEMAGNAGVEPALDLGSQM